MSSDGGPDLWRSVEFLLGYCAELPDMTPADYQNAATQALPVPAMSDVTAADCELPVIRTVRIAPAPTIGDAIAAALAEGGTEEADWSLEYIDHAIRLIANHYDLHADQVADEVWRIEAEEFAKHGLPFLGRIFEQPMGWSLLASVVAEQLADRAACGLPAPPSFTIH